jgi:hypothetical protein
MFDRLPPRVAPLARSILKEGTPQRALARFGVDAARTTRAYTRT